MPKKLFLLFSCFVTLNIIAQPYIDPINISYTSAFRTNKNNATPFSHLYIGSDLPLKIKPNCFIVLSPFFEKWNIDSAAEKKYLPQLSSVALAISAIIPLGKDHWSLTLTAIPRFNSEGLKQANSFQTGGVMLAGYKKNEQLKYKLGVYVNSDFFGVFVMPLAGIDWKITGRDNLFGILPGRLTYEHKLNNNFYTGATFRAITNSYRLGNGNYLRIEDNQLSAYLYCYATNYIAFTGEAGYGIFRKLRLGKAPNKIYLQDYNWGDGMFIKLGASYRIRL